MNAIDRIIDKVKKDTDIGVVLLLGILLCAILTVSVVSLATSNSILRGVAEGKNQALEYSLLREEAARGRILALEETLAKSNTPLGVRTNNPLNLVKTAIHWKGETECESNREISPGINQEVECFVSPMYGVRAGIKTMLAKRDRHGAKTIRDLIEMWATANHDEYLSFIEAKTGFHESTLLESLNYPLTLALLTEAMLEFEIGQKSPYKFQEIYEVAQLLVWDS